ncbi:MAG: hypothetical protein RRY69_03030, partial [Oscillospiraceae bacterium]
MKKFYLGLAVFLLLLLVPFAAYFAYIQSIPPQFTNTLMGTASYKMELLKQKDEPRIIFAGGSSAAYGVDCERIQGELDVKCIDIGVVYGIGIEFYESLLMDELREGDIVYFAPEYGMWNDQIGYNLVWCCCENYGELLAKIPLQYWPKIIAGPFFTYSKEKLAIYRSGSCDGSAFVEMGECGDMTNVRENIMEDGYLKDDPITVNTSYISEKAVKALNRLDEYAKSVGAKLLVGYPPAVREALVSDAKERALFAEAVEERLTATVVGDIEDSFMSARYFYDTNFHLNTKGVALRSEYLIELLEEYV